MLLLVLECSTKIIVSKSYLNCKVINCKL
jgi:hypothetical protein